AATHTRGRKAMPSTQAITAVTAAAAALGSGLFLAPSGAQARQSGGGNEPVDIEVFAPDAGGNARLAGAGCSVDREVDFPAGSLGATGFNGLQLTGPAG